MSGLARLVRQRGAEVSGSDRGDNAAVAAVRAAGIDVTLDQTAASVPAGCDTLVISAAIPEDHPEVIEARRRGVEVVKYAAMLGRLMGQSGTAGVAIAGTHGKSTTTAILCHVLLSAGLDPSFILGAHCAQIGGGSRAGGRSVSGEWGVVSGEETSSATRKDASPHSPTPPHHSPPPHLLIAEACEYDRSFHHLRPTHAVVLNVEADHLDIYDSLDAIVESFATFARLLPPASGGNSGGGSLLIQHESPHRLAVTAGVSCKTETIGFASQADWRVRVEGQTVTLHHHGQAVCAWVQPMPGDHFAYNAAAAAVTAHRLGATWEAIGPAVAN
ncbi:MAG: Mur ligase domain-containing protein, partial [Planctomycetota bacterium]